MKELLELINARRRAPGVPYAVATVLRVEGSSYRRPGARMLVNIHGRVAGSVSGGCLERNVVAQGQHALLDGEARIFSFDTTDLDDISFGTSLGCHGKIWIGLEVLAPRCDWPLEQVVDEVRRRRKPAALITHTFEAGRSVRFKTHANFGDGVDEKLPPAGTSDDVTQVLRTRKSRFLDLGGSGSVLVEWLGPPLSLLLFGAGPDVLPMLRIARELGHEVTVIDRRPEYARADNFPGATRVILAKPHEVPAYLKPDERSAAVLMNHHYDTDRDVLASLLPLDLPYLAMLGPKKRTTRILEELRQEGHDVAAIAALHGPAGLDIGAETPEQIALAILAEIQATLAGRSGTKLRNRQAPIHAEAFDSDRLACILPG
jgi:xanthine dehydrogenase accessory factor